MSSHHLDEVHHINGEQVAQKNQPRRTAVFNLKAVVTETGLKPDTLRAWERRYGLPNPERTAGGHRLYSQRDIDMLKWFSARQDEGLSISRAIKLWKRIEATGQDPLLHESYSLGARGVAVEMPVPAAVLDAGNGVEKLRRTWIEACMNFDERTAVAVMSQAFALFPMETVCFEILQRALSEIGQGWYEGEYTVQQEHFASALALRRLDTLVASTPSPTRNGRILVACPPEERHTFSLLMITLFLRRAGWDVIYLGANIPIDRLSSTIESTRPHLVVMAAQTLYTASTMLPMSLLLQRERIATAYGGAVFNFLPQLRDRMPGYFLSERLDGVVGRVNELLSAPPPTPTYEVASRNYKVTLDHFKARRALVEANVWQQMSSEDEQTHLKNANKDLAQNIIAALTFGDIDLLDTNLEWVRGLLINFHYRMPEQTMATYMAAYCRACEAHLDERGEVLLDWLRRVMLKSDM